MKKQIIEKELPKLLKMSDTFKMVIPLEVETKIRYLQQKFPSTEWSGVLFFNYQGNFKDKNLTIICKDIFPMDLGDAAYTAFFMSPEVTSYMADNELFECDLGLIHSHHKMATFFSSTDQNTLRSEGNDRNCFVSLIVNNAGEYSAAITRKVVSERSVTIQHIKDTYEFFGEGSVEGDNVETEQHACKDTIIQYFMLDIEKPEVANPFAYLDKRFEDIAQDKKNTVREVPKTSSSIKSFDWSDFEMPTTYRPSENRYPMLWQEDTPISLFETERKGLIPDPKKIQEAVTNLLWCAPTITATKINLNEWVEKHMVKLYNKAFNIEECDDLGQAAFEEFADFFVEWIIENFQDKKLRDAAERLDVDYEVFGYAAIAEAIMDKLNTFKPNPFITYYCSVLQTFIEYAYH